MGRGTRASRLGDPSDFERAKEERTRARERAGKERGGVAGGEVETIERGEKAVEGAEI